MIPLLPDPGSDGSISLSVGAGHAGGRDVPIRAMWVTIGT